MHSSITKDKTTTYTQAMLTSAYSIMPIAEQRKRFIQALHGKNKGYVGIPRKLNGSWNEKHYANLKNIDNIYNMIDASADSYITANVLNSSLRKNDNVAGINTIHLDIDVYHDADQYDTEEADHIIGHILDCMYRTMPEPTIVTLSGRGITWIYRYDHLLMDADSINLHDLAFAELIKNKKEELEKIEHVQVDVISDHARVVRMPGSMNNKANRYARLLTVSDQKYNPDVLYSELGLKVQREVQAFSRKLKMKAEHSQCDHNNDARAVINNGAGKDNLIIFAPMRWKESAKTRIPKLMRVPEVVKMVDGSKRHRLIFALYCHARLIYTREYAAELAVEMNNKFVEPLDMKDLAAQLMRVDRHVESGEYWIHGDGTYTFGADTLCEFLPSDSGCDAIKDDIMRSHMARKNAKKNQEAAMTRDKRVAELWNTGLSHAKIVKQMVEEGFNLCLRTAKNITKRLGLNAKREDKDIDFDELKRYKRCKKEENVKSAAEQKNGANFLQKQGGVREGYEQLPMTFESPVHVTPAQQHAIELMESGVNCFIAGLGGTGKSYVISQYYNTLDPSRTLNLAMFGKAAAQLHNGRTLHSALYIDINMFDTLDFVASRTLKALKNIDTIFIDEIGTVRTDVFDYVCRAIIEAERLYKHSIQLIVSGDFGQLEPVVDDEDRELLQLLYKDSKQFDARTSEFWQIFGFAENTVTLTTSMRQDASDIQFNDILNRVYNDHIDDGVQRFLADHVDASCMYDESAIHLCGHVYTASMINNEIMNQHVDDVSYTVFASSDMIHDQSVYLGMPVMTIVNQRKGLYANGTLGKIIKINKKSIVIETDDHKHILVKTCKYWDDGRRVKGLPIVPAYAITVHKSQGMTLDSAIVHCDDLWSQRQLYVALSRVRSADNLRVTSANISRIVQHREHHVA